MFLHCELVSIAPSGSKLSKDRQGTWHIAHIRTHPSALLSPVFMIPVLLPSASGRCVYLCVLQQKEQKRGVISSSSSNVWLFVFYSLLLLLCRNFPIWIETWLAASVVESKMLVEWNVLEPTMLKARENYRCWRQLCPVLMVRGSHGDKSYNLILGSGIWMNLIEQKRLYYSEE